MNLPRLRWCVAALLFGAAVLNYVDRQALSLLAPTIQRDLGLDDQAYANVVNAFLVAYTLAYLFSGFVVDRLGARVSLSLFVVWWSVANMFTAFARSAVSLGMFRFLLGLGEAGNWLAAPKTVARWFPARERGLAIGLYTLGATIGATIAPFLVIHLAKNWGWQGAFVVTGALGLVWVVPWLWIARDPEKNPLVTAAQRDALRQALQQDAAVSSHREEAWSWREALRRSSVWRLMLARLLTDPVWYFYQFWFAKYLFAERAISQEQLSITWVVFLAADIGTLAGGWFSGLFIKRGATPGKARLRVMLLCAVVVPLSPFVPFVDSMAMVLAIGVLVVLAHMAWLINLSALVVDSVPEKSLGLVFGLVAAGSSLGGIMMNKAVGWIVQAHDYTWCFVAMAFVHPVAWLLLRTIGETRNVEPISPLKSHA